MKLAPKIALDSIEPTGLYSVGEVALILGIHLKTARRKLKACGITPRAIAGSGCRRVFGHEICKMAGYTKPAAIPTQEAANRIADARRRIAQA